MADEDTSQAPVPESTPPEPAQEVPVHIEIPSPALTEPLTSETQTAQMPASEALPSEPEPIAPDSINSLQAAQKPSATASVPNVPVPVPTHDARDLLVKARATIQDRKRKKLDKILEALNAKGIITNDGVEKLLHVSDATATRYLATLEKEGRIVQVGRTGKAVAYAKVN